jgi:hypothetical protein
MHTHLRLRLWACDSGWRRRERFGVWSTEKVLATVSMSCPELAGPSVLPRMWAGSGTTMSPCCFSGHLRVILGHQTLSSHCSQSLLNHLCWWFFGGVSRKIWSPWSFSPGTEQRGGNRSWGGGGEDTDLGSQVSQTPRVSCPRAFCNPQIMLQL